MTQIAFLGTGLLGAAFVEAAVGRGEQVTVWNRTPEKAKALEKIGARAASSPADAVRGIKRIHLVVKDDAAVDEVIAALRPGLDRDAIIIDHTTTQPALTAERSKRLNSEGVNYLHCPVFIGPAAARKAQGTILAAGPKKLFDAVREPLEKQAERVEYFGERPDLAAVYKLCGNLLIIGMTGLVADMFAMSTAVDLPPLEALGLLEFFNPSGVFPSRGRAMATGNLAPSFELTMARKDVRLMIETAAKGGKPLSVLPGLAARMDELIASGHGAEDLAAIGVESV